MLHIIRVDPNYYLSRSATLPYVWKNISKTKPNYRMCVYNQCRDLILLRFFFGAFIHNWRPFMSEVMYLFQTFTECLINTHILICRHDRCHCKLWNASWFYYFFLEILRTQLTSIHVSTTAPSKWATLKINNTLN